MPYSLFSSNNHFRKKFRNEKLFVCGDFLATYSPFLTLKLNSCFLLNRWKVIVGLLSTLVVMLLLAACCYYCCGGNRQGYGRARGRFFASNSRTAPGKEPFSYKCI